MKSPKNLTELQSLNGKLAALSRFLSRASEKQLPFFMVLIECNKKKVYELTEVEVAFQDLKIAKIMSTANQQTPAESGTEGRPLILKKGSYVPWASRFLRFLDNKREEGELMRNSIDNGPYKRKLINDPNNDGKKMYEPIKDLSTKDKDRYYADIKVMNYILQGIANDIYNSVDAYEDAQGM
ncbi:hypothetical protein Tco_0492272 [Tanacetum coccineum]